MTSQPGAPPPVDPRAAPVEAQAPGQAARIGPYEVLGELGQGGMGVVYRARHGSLGVVRAVKLMLRADPKALGRFQREVANLARTRHPNVAAIHEAGSDAGRPWFAMELVEGRPLNEVLAQGRPSLERALVLAIGICDGVAALHQAGVVHRDLKPANVVVRPDGRPVVIDLGLAIAPEQDERLTRTGTMLGTLTYMAPEQLHRAHQVSPRTDVYALGCILYELATGAPAIDPELGVHGIVAEVLRNDRPTPRSADPALPPALDDVCARATARDPRRRFADAGELAAALRLVLTRPEGPAPMPGRGALVGGLVACALAAGLALALWVAGREDPPRPGPPPDCRLPPEEVERGRRALEALRAAPPAERLAGLARWADEFAGHPAGDDAGALRDRTLLETPRRRWTVKGLRRAAFAGDDARALTFAGDGEVAEWDLRGGERVRAWRPLPSLDDVAVAGTTAAAVDRKERAWVLDLAAGTAREVDRAAAGERVVLTRDGARLAVGTGWDTKRRPQVTLVDAATGAVVATHRTPDRVRDLAFSPDGRTLAASYGHEKGFDLTLEHGLQLLDAAAGLAVRHRVPFRGLPTALAYVDGGRLLAVACDGVRIVLLDAGTGQALNDFTGAVPRDDQVTWQNLLGARAHAGMVMDLAGGGPRLFSIGWRPDELRAWDVATRRELLVRPLAGAVLVAASADGRSALLTSTADDAVELWDLVALE